jgi:hypothetical protein
MRGVRIKVSLSGRFNSMFICRERDYCVVMYVPVYRFTLSFLEARDRSIGGGWEASAISLPDLADSLERNWYRANHVLLTNLKVANQEPH